MGIQSGMIIIVGGRILMSWNRGIVSSGEFTNLGILIIDGRILINSEGNFGCHRIVDIKLILRNIEGSFIKNGEMVR
jgi:hypothetical protein